MKLGRGGVVLLTGGSGVRVRLELCEGVNEVVGSLCMRPPGSIPRIATVSFFRPQSVSSYIRVFSAAACRSTEPARVCAPNMGAGVPAAIPTTDRWVDLLYLTRLWFGQLESLLSEKT